MTNGPATNHKQHHVSDIRTSSLPSSTDLFIAPLEESFPPRDSIAASIVAEIQKKPYRAFLQIKEAGQHIVTQLRIAVSQLEYFHGDAPLCGDGGATLEKFNTLLSVMSVLTEYETVWHDHYIGPNEALERLSSETTGLLQFLDELNDKRWSHDHEHLLKCQVKEFAEAVDSFFLYEPKEHCIEGVGKHKIPYSVSYPTFLTLLEGSKSFLFDVDDLMAMTEVQQRIAWSSAIREWAASDEFKSRNRHVSQHVIEKLVRTVEYCLDKDRTSGLLQLLCDITDSRRIAFDVPHGETKTSALEKILNVNRGKVLARYVSYTDPELAIRFAPGAAELLQRLYQDGFKIALCTNTPKEVSEKFLRPLFRASPLLPDLDEVIPEGHRVFGDVTPFGLPTPIRKSHPAMWLAAARATGVKPSEAVILDNSLGNCSGASELSRYQDDPILHAFERELFHHPASNHLEAVDGRRPLFGIGESFRAVVGITNSHGNLEQWQDWANESQNLLGLRAIAGCNVTTRVLFESLAHIKA